MCLSLSLSLCVFCVASSIRRFFFTTDCCVIFRIDGLVPNSIKAWGRGSMKITKKPHTCTIGRSGGCTIANISGRKKRKVEEHLRACDALGPDDKISSAVEAVSFDDTLGEIGRVADEGQSEDRVIPVGTMEMYEVIVDFGEVIG